MLTGTNVINPPMPIITLDTIPNLLFTGTFATYQWFLNDTAIPGATSNHITQSAPIGSVYKVVVSDANGCFDTSAAFVVGGALTVKTPVNSDEIRIYPNPVASMLHIDAPEKVLVSIMSPDGRILINRKEAITVNVSQLADGMYMIMVYDENNVLLKTAKFIKVR